MPIKPKKIRNRNVELDETISKFFRTGRKPKRDTPAWDIYVERHFDSDAIGKAWKIYREACLARWKKEKRKIPKWALEP